MESEAWVRAVYVIGFIFCATSLLLNVSVMVITSVLKTSLSIDTGTFTLMNIQASGFVAMLYPRIHRWRHRPQEQVVL